MASGRKAKQQRRLKLPGGGTVNVPDRTSPGGAALARIQAGIGRPGDMEHAREWLATTDPRYWAHMSRVAAAPQVIGDVVADSTVVTPVDAAKKIQARFYEMVVSGEVGMCVHVRQLAPQLAIWAPWAPGKIRCEACFGEVGGRIAGTIEDRRCDACGYIPKHVIQLTKMIPPAEYRQVIVPILITFGLCQKCAGPDITAAFMARGEAQRAAGTVSAR